MSWSLCHHCGGQHNHAGVCPRIKSIEFHPNGTVKRYEYRDQSQKPEKTYPGESHGHIVPNAGGKARCGGPALCDECRAEYTWYLKNDPGKVTNFWGEIKDLTEGAR